jgi:hypothetical protein
MKTMRKRVAELRASGGDRRTLHFPGETMGQILRSQARNHDASMTAAVMRLIAQACAAEER